MATVVRCILSIQRESWGGGEGGCRIACDKHVHVFDSNWQVLPDYVIKQKFGRLKACFERLKAQYRLIVGMLSVAIEVHPAYIYVNQNMNKLILDETALDKYNGESCGGWGVN